MASELSLDQRILLEQRLLSRLPTAPPRRQPEDLAPQPLSFAQESMWYFDQLVPNSPLYNIPYAFRLTGKLDRGALDKAFDSLFQRHAALRTGFVLKNGTPLQAVRPSGFRLEFADLSGVPVAQREEDLRRLLGEEGRRPFKLLADCLIRARLISLEEEVHVLALTLHHIVSDFTSLEILLRELGLFYQAAVEGRTCELPPLPMSFPEWAARARRRAESHELDALLAYWKETLQSYAGPIEMPGDRPRSQSPNFRGFRLPLQIPKRLRDSLAELAAQEGATLYMALLGAFQVLLGRYSGREDILVGSPVATRGEPGTEGMVGLLLNTLAVRTDLSGEPSFREVLGRVRRAAVNAFAHQEVPFERVVEALRLPRAGAQNPLCQAVFQYLPHSVPTPAWPGLNAEALLIEPGTAKFDLTLTLLEGVDGLQGDIEYNSDLFDAATVQRMIANFGVLLESIIRSPDAPVGRLDLLTATERQTILGTWNDTATPYPREASIHELFEAQARDCPERMALVAGEVTLTYGELNRRANQLARHLERMGVAPGQPVGVCVERSVRAIISLLAILKAGGAYVPLDPAYPEERLRFMIANSGTSLLLTTSTAKRLQDLGTRALLLDSAQAAIDAESDVNLARPVAADALAYVIYTSGSTGQPKGVAVPHRAVVRLVKNTNYADFSPSQVFLHFAPLSFDASTFEIWGPLLNGARLVVYPPEFESIEQVARVLQRYEVTTLWLTAGLFHQIVEQQLENLSHVRQLLAGGDVLSVPHITQVLRALPNCQLINGYGPTENTTFTCCYRFPKTFDPSRSAPIGRPISHTQVYILDRYLAPVPIGVPGELCAAGDGLARGYLNSPELNARKFVPNPFSPEPGARLYRTGDQARYLADGTIEFLGRSDDQVKINGFRIHLGEIEAALLALPEVRQAAVLAQAGPSGSKHLAAYVVLGSTSAGDVRTQLSQTLPGYLVPAQIIPLPSLPLTANGKVDRRALLQTEGGVDDAAGRTVRNGGGSRALHDPLEERVLQVWREVLGHHDLNVDDNFFDLGGHSLLATRIISRLNQALGANVSLGTFLAHPTVRALAQKIAVAPKAAAPGPIQRRQAEPGA